MAKPTPAQRFWACVDKRPGDDGCWMWTGKVVPILGYGMFSEYGKQILAHRWSAAAAGVDFGRHEKIMHLCPNRLCVRPEHLRLQPGSRERFWAKVDKREGEDACWVWTGSVNNSGYGTFGYEGKTHLAHRLAAAWAGVPVMDWLCVRHSCRLGRCVRPSHLFNATKAEVRASFRIVPEDRAQYRVPGAVYMRAVDRNGEVRRQWIAPQDVAPAKRDMERYYKQQKKIAARARKRLKKAIKCIVCKVVIPGANYSRKYCSAKCRQKPYERAPLQCHCCGREQPYVINGKTPKYCSPSCRSGGRIQINRDKRARESCGWRPGRPDRLAYCCICGDLFAYPNNQPRLCCSRSCGAKKRQRVLRAFKDKVKNFVLMVTRFCHTCDQGFRCNALDPVTTCSDACRQPEIV